MSDHKYYDAQGNVIASLDTSFPFTTESTLSGMHDGQMFAITKADLSAYPICFFSTVDRTEILRINADGRIFWRGREVESDDALRAAMMEVRDVMVGIMGGG